MSRMIDTYNAEAAAGHSAESELSSDETRISWSSSLKPRALRGEAHAYSGSSVRTSLYRPFSKVALYFDSIFNHRPGQMRAMFPTANTPNIGLYCLATGSPKPFSVIATDQLPDLALYGSNSGQFFPRWTYVPGPKRAENDMLFDPEGELVDGYRRVDNITDQALARFQQAFAPGVTKDDVFHYVYGVLHSPQYRTRFAADLKKMLPRIPLAASTDDFRGFADAGQRLLALHVGYESVEPYPLQEVVAPAVGLNDWDLFAVGAKMKFPRTGGDADRSQLVVNPHVTLADIPEQAHRYQLGSRSALEWIIDRYWTRTDKASGIVNDPNDWSREVGNPRYIVDLLKRVVTVSVETMQIVDALPELPLGTTHA